MIKHFASKQFVAFLCTGGVAALVNFLSRIIYSEWFSFSAAIIIAYVTGMITAFILAKIFVFKKATQTFQRSIFFFCLVNLASIAQTLIISLILANYLLPFFHVIHFKLEIAHAAGVVVPALTSYIGHKRWSFRELPY